MTSFVRIGRVARIAQSISPSVVCAVFLLMAALPTYAGYGGGSPVYQSWYPTGRASLSVSGVSANVAFGSAAPIAIVTNTGTTDAYFALGSSNAVTVTTSSGYLIKAGECVAVNLFPFNTQFTYLAGITGGSSSTLYAETGVGAPGNCPALPLGGSSGGGSASNVNVTQFGGTNVSTGTGASGSGIPRVTISNDSSLAANQSVNQAQVGGTATDTNSGNKSAGTQRVVIATDQPALTNALKVDGSAVTQPVFAASLPLPAGAATSSGQTTGNSSLSTIATNTTNAGTPTLQSGSTTAVTQATAANLNTTAVTSGGATIAKDSSLSTINTTLGSPMQQTGGSLTANAGTNLNTSALALSANQPTNAAQGSTTSGQTGGLTQGAVTTVAPSYTTGQTDPLSLTPAGALRTDSSAVTQPVSGTVTTTPPANASTNVAQVAGTATDTNSGNKSAGTQRVVLATDQPALTNALKVDGSAVTQPVSGTVTTTPPANASSNVSQFGGTNVSTGTGAGGAGIPRVTISNDSSLAANQSVNAAQVGGTATDTNSGNKSAGTQRVVLATDQPALTNAQPANITQVGGSTYALGQTTKSASAPVTLPSDQGMNNGCAGQTISNTKLKPFSNAGSSSNLQLVAGVSSQKVYVCAIKYNPVASTVNVAMVEGTTTTNACDTSTTGMDGGATAATGNLFTANEGEAYGNGVGLVALTATAADNVCLLFSSGVQVSGVITYAQF